MRAVIRREDVDTVTDGIVVSVQVGRVRELGRVGAPDVMDRPWRSGIFKEPVEGRLLAAGEGFEGDEQADLVNHGGLDKALLAYSAENLARWRDVLGELRPGAFGENVTISGLDETSVCIGDLFRLGDALVECSQPRQPCWKLDRKLRRRDLGARVVETGRSGWYLRVLEPGLVGAGDAVVLADRPHPRWPVARAARIMHRVDGDARDAAELAAIPELAASWRETLAARTR
jgi:MOSC domain-containing protein YiiM